MRKGSRQLSTAGKQVCSKVLANRTGSLLHQRYTSTSARSASWGSWGSRILLGCAATGLTGYYLSSNQRNVLLADDGKSTAKASESQPTPVSQEYCPTCHSPITNRKYRKKVYSIPGWDVYATKSSMTLQSVEGVVKKRGVGWSGCTAAATPGWFWVVADNDKRRIFKVNFATGEAKKIGLGTKLQDLESIANVCPQFVEEGQEGFFAVTSSSTNRQDLVPQAARVRLAYIQVPKNNYDLPSMLEEGVHQFTLDDFRTSLLALLQNHPDLVSIDAGAPSKGGGLDIEGSAFIPCTYNSSNPDEHIILLGLRGPSAKNGDAIILGLGIPKKHLKNPRKWHLYDQIDTISLDGMVIRDMAFDEASKSVVILSGSHGQDKTKQDLNKYPLWRYDLATKKVTKFGEIPRLPISQLLEHKKDLYSAAFEEAGIKESSLADIEKTGTMSSPEGICAFSDGVLVVWDHNDAGLFAYSPNVHF